MLLKHPQVFEGGGKNRNGKTRTEAEADEAATRRGESGSQEDEQAGAKANERDPVMSSAAECDRQG